MLNFNGGYEMRSVCCSMVVLGVLQLFSPTTFADDAAKKALAKAQFLLRQTNAEKVSLQTQLQDINKELEVFKKETELKFDEAVQREEKLEGNLSRWKESHSSLKEKLRKERVAHIHTKNRADNLHDNLIKQTDNFKICHANNTALTKVNNELLTLYDNKSFASILKEREPVTGLSRVKVENIVQSYKYQIEDLDLNLNVHLLKDVEQAGGS